MWLLLIKSDIIGFIVESHNKRVVSLSFWNWVVFSLLLVKQVCEIAHLKLLGHWHSGNGLKSEIVVWAVRWGMFVSCQIYGYVRMLRQVWVGKVGTGLSGHAPLSAIHYPPLCDGWCSSLTCSSNLKSGKSKWLVITKFWWPTSSSTFSGWEQIFSWPSDSNT